MKQCRECTELKSPNEYHKCKNYKDGLQIRCKICNCRIALEWKKKNKERIKIVNGEWEKRNWEKVKSIKKKYSDANPGKVNANTARRRALKKQATPKWLTKTQIKEIQKFYIEAARLTKETGIVHEVDHIVPLQGETVRGMHVPWNLQVIPFYENRKKRNLLL